MSWDVCIYLIFFVCVHFSVCGHTDCFCILDAMNNAEISVVVWIALADFDLNFFGYIARSGITGSYGSSIFNYLRILHILES